MKSPNTFVVKPDWSSFTTKSGLFLGEEAFDRAEDMPVHLYPTKGEVVCSPEKYDIKKGATLYFTWNGVSFNKCISPIEEENLFILNQAWYAYEQDGELKTTDDYFLLMPIKSEVQITDSGLIVGGAQIIGDADNYEIVEDSQDMALVGVVVVVPENSHGIEIGDKVCIVNNSDVKVNINGTSFYRTRASEMVFKYER